MKINIRSRNQAFQGRRRVSFVGATVIVLAGLVISSLLMPVRAAAALGGDVNSVEADRQQLRGARTVQAVDAKYSVHVITTPYGTVVREYVAPDGTVFGVAWRGPFLPNFQQILGDNYQKFVQAAQEARSGAVRHSRNAPLSVTRPDFVMRSGGHMRAYAGRAYLPGLVPQGVDPKDIK